MGFLQTVKDNYQTLREGKPGERFRGYVHQRRKRRGGNFTIGRVLNFGGGIALILTGLAIGWLPGPGGFLAIIGLALIALELPFIADILDRTEVVIRKLLNSVKRFYLAIVVKCRRLTARSKP
ncbi:hypothetical protein NHH03_09760 [Stieleria sp. TO1_6]|uniref:hypothetical protein n=1 Tax=Stieleria tagensis TaxID=2956795 RepID=UPI00209B769C|nr:hypothetical protein [Stieleria tagensis]MCO8122022.1 hypothetical protein [Stieleria tagensis]